MVGESDQIEGDEHGGEVFLAVTEIVLKVVALGLERVKALVLDLPSGTAAGGEFDDSAAIHRQVGDEAVAVSDLALRVGDLDREPVDVHSVLAVAQGQVAQPSVGIAKARFPTLERLDVLARFDAGKISVSVGWEAGLQTNRKFALAWCTASQIGWQEYKSSPR
jgi:hypothetical protein